MIDWLSLDFGIGILIGIFAMLLALIIIAFIYQKRINAKLKPFSDMAKSILEDEEKD